MKSYPDVDAYLADARTWRDEMAALRAVLLDCGLEEAVKWGKPCYSAAGGNIAIVQPFKGFLALLFVKGALLTDAEGVLHAQGENTRSAMRMEFTSLEAVAAQAEAVRACVREAVALERAGVRVPRITPTELVLPDELVDRLDGDDEFAAAWRGLTPGRQRSWVLHFSGAKQATTRVARVEKAMEKVLAGKGWNER